MDISDKLNEAVERNIFVPEHQNKPELKEILRNVIPLAVRQYTINEVKGTGSKWMTNITCGISEIDGVENFIRNYNFHNGEELLILCRKPCSARSVYLVNNYYRCRFDTGYEPTRDAKNVQASNPSKRFKNTYCPFALNIKIRKGLPNNFLCTINIEYNHNCSTKCLEALTFKSVRPEVIKDYQLLFEKGMSPSVAEFLRELRCRFPSDIKFHQAKADRGICPRRRDVNVFYRKYCADFFGGKNGSVMFDRMEETIIDFMEKKPGTIVKWQNYDSVESTSLPYSHH